MRVGRHDLPPPQAWGENSGSPRIAVYDDGLVVMRRGDAFASSMLPPDELRSLAARVDAFASFEKESFTASRVLHAPVYVLHGWTGGQLNTVRVFGDLASTAADRTATPPPLLSLVDALLKIEKLDAKPWQPEQVEVRLCERAVKAGQRNRELKLPRWPAGWPAPESGKQQTYLQGCWAVKLPGVSREQVEALVVKGVGPGSAEIAVGDKPWLLTLSRFVLPSEELWEAR
jgi:hypothetical protein